MFYKLLLCLFFMVGVNIFADNDDVLDNPPVAKLVFYEAAKKGLLPNVYYQPKVAILDHFFFGTTVGFDIKKWKLSKILEIGTCGFRMDILNTIFDFILYKSKSDVTRFKYDDFLSGSCWNVFKACFMTNVVFGSFFLRVLFFRINFVEVNLGQFVYLVNVLFSSDMFRNEERYGKIVKFAKANIIASIFVPSLHIDLSELISFIKRDKTQDTGVSDIIDNKTEEVKLNDNAQEV